LIAASRESHCAARPAIARLAWSSRAASTCVEAVDYSYALMDLTVYGRQESWEDAPPGWPQQCTATGRSDDLGPAEEPAGEAGPCH
jgi:succinylarginine dihydrolase